MNRGRVLDYQERVPPEGINTSRSSPLKEFLMLLGGLIVVTLVSIGLISVFAKRSRPMYRSTSNRQ